MMNFIYLVILPMLFFGAVLAIFMYCSHYLLSYAKDAVGQAINKQEEESSPTSTEE